MAKSRDASHFCVAVEANRSRNSHVIKNVEGFSRLRQRELKPLQMSPGRRFCGAVKLVQGQGRLWYGNRTTNDPSLP